MLARDEEPEPTTQESMFNYVRLSDGGPRRHEGPRSEIEIIAELARRGCSAGGPIDWAAMRATGRIREAIGKIVPGLEQIGEIDRTKQEFQIAGRAFHEPVFATAGRPGEAARCTSCRTAGGDTATAADDGSQRGAIQYRRL